MGQYRHTISNIMAMPPDDLIPNTVQLYRYEEGKFNCFFDKPNNKSGSRLNIVGHSSLPGSMILFYGACEYAHGMNVAVFCKTIHKLVTDLNSRKQDIQSVRIIACYSGKNGLAQALANHLNMPVKGSLGGARLKSVNGLRPTLNLNVDRHFIDKPDESGYYFSEERDRQRRHDRDYGQYSWYYPQLQRSDSGSEFDTFVSQRVPRPQRSDSDSEFDSFVSQRIARKDC